MRLSLIYKQSVFYPSIAVVVMAFIYFSLIVYFAEEPSYEAMYTWYEQIIFNVLVAIVYTSFMSALSLPLLLNERENIRVHKFRSLMCWFLLPYGFMLLMLGKAINEAVTLGSFGELIMAVLATGPFFIGLMRGYLKFKSQNQLS